MNILFLTDNFPPEVNAPATRTYEHCREWVKKENVEVTVITCAPNFPQGKVFDGYKNKIYQKENIDGIRVIRVWTYISSNDGFLTRILDYLSFAVMSFLAGLFAKADIIIGTSPQFFTAVSARALSAIKFKPWVMEVRDLWPESIAAVGAMKKDTIVFRMLERIEKSLYNSASKIIVVTDSFKKHIKNLGVNGEKIQIIKNGVDLKKFAPIYKKTSLVKKYGLEDKFILGYLGTHGMAHALSFILSCAQEIDDDFHFILQGDGAEKMELIKQSEEMRLKNVSFLPFVSKKVIQDYISIIDISLINLKKSDTFLNVIPSKIFENAAMEKPILIGVDGEARALVEEYNAGVFYEPENKSSFFSALGKIKEPEKYIEYQEGCRKLAQDFSREKLAQRMLSSIKELNQ